MAVDGDQKVQDHIEELVAEEHDLLTAGGQQEGLLPWQHARLEAIKVELDRYWDLLRQRRAHEEYGIDPDGNTSILDPDSVESKMPDDPGSPL